MVTHISIYFMKTNCKIITVDKKCLHTNMSVNKLTKI